MRPPIFSRLVDQSTPEVTHATDFDRAAEALAREHDALARMQGSESERVDGLVEDVGIIKGNVQSLQGDMSRVASSVERLANSMVDMNRHTILLETNAAETAKLCAAFENHESRMQTVEKAIPEKLSERLHSVEVAIPPLVEMRQWTVRGILGVIGLVGLAVIGTVIVRGGP